MKTFVAAIFLLMGWAARSAATSPVVESHDGYWRGTEYYIFVDSPKHLAAVEWTPERGDVPLSIPAALAAARKALQRMVGAGHEEFVCDEIRLRNHGGGGERWVYIVRFAVSEDDPATGRRYQVSLPFIVYLDGFVQSPEKRPSAEPADPAPTAATTAAPPPAKAERTLEQRLRALDDYLAKEGEPEAESVVSPVLLERARKEVATRVPTAKNVAAKIQFATRGLAIVTVSYALDDAAREQKIQFIHGSGEWTLFWVPPAAKKKA